MRVMPKGQYKRALRGTHTDDHTKQPKEEGTGYVGVCANRNVTIKRSRWGVFWHGAEPVTRCRCGLLVFVEGPDI